MQTTSIELSEMLRELERQDAEWTAIYDQITSSEGVPSDAEVLIKADFLDELRDLAAAKTRPEGTKGVLA